jgi:hypothetical protein
MRTGIHLTIRPLFRVNVLIFGHAEKGVWAKKTKIRRPFVGNGGLLSGGGGGRRPPVDYR